MKKAFWKGIRKGAIHTLIAMLVIASAWLAFREDRVKQTRMQMAYLADLSGYTLREAIPEETQLIASELAKFTRVTEGRINHWVIFLGGTNHYEFGSYVYQLSRKYPNAISGAANGDTTFAQQLEAKWLKDRHIRFFPFGLTLMLMFLSGLGLTLVRTTRHISE